MKRTLSVRGQKFSGLSSQQVESLGESTRTKKETSKHMQCMEATLSSVYMMMWAVMKLARLQAAAQVLTFAPSALRTWIGTVLQPSAP
mmetsp:Transcript_58250/g.136755  ORF Transcript_58250/g.136755 Transcript_58250/m.136755 type:complete len:88 (-) Transcript_58250:312-575(-)